MSKHTEYYGRLVLNNKVAKADITKSLVLSKYANYQIENNENVCTWIDESGDFIEGAKSINTHNLDIFFDGHLYYNIDRCFSEIIEEHEDNINHEETCVKGLCFDGEFTITIYKNGRNKELDHNEIKEIIGCTPDEVSYEDEDEGKKNHYRFVEEEAREWLLC